MPCSQGAPTLRKLKLWPSSAGRYLRRSLLAPKHLPKNGRRIFGAAELDKIGSVLAYEVLADTMRKPVGHDNHEGLFEGRIRGLQYLHARSPDKDGPISGRPTVASWTRTISGIIFAERPPPAMLLQRSTLKIRNIVF
ncbi:uncharacterized protein DSM5745_07741 [Aspergillus mulundensis]|uniref:Uncharacterized protein n=1 Tax=Aspergillus mulundensis TaxID=1810919 RepID=A0A3D8REU3_9EURO|nr:hypothetical protein DSM5745_07741 [Aspergillus mulundensis]RDW72569.1 hypothetical protein DSM5745_07741 [Aspergillus mulundensis]